MITLPSTTCCYVSLIFLINLRAAGEEIYFSHYATLLLLLLQFYGALCRCWSWTAFLLHEDFLCSTEETKSNRFGTTRCSFLLHGSKTCKTQTSSYLRGRSHHAPLCPLQRRWRYTRGRRRRRAPPAAPADARLHWSSSANPDTAPPTGSYTWTHICSQTCFIMHSFSHLADAFIKRHLQIEAIRTNKRATIRKCYNNCLTCSKIY